MTRRMWGHIPRLLRSLLIYGPLAALLFWFILRQVAVGDVIRLLGNLQISQLLLLILLNGGVLLTLVLRWSLLLGAEGYWLPLHTLFAYRLAAFGVTYFTPGPQFGGEPLQVYLVNVHHQVPVQSAVAAVTMDKLLEMMVNFGFLVGGAMLLLNRGVVPRTIGYQSLGLALFLFVLPLGLLVAYRFQRRPLTALLVQATKLSIMARLPLDRLTIALAESERHIIVLCRQRAGTVSFALLVTLVGWGLMVWEFIYTASILGVTLSPTSAVMVLMAARIAYLLPMPAGLGTFEASLFLAFDFLHYAPAAALSLSLLIRARDALLGLCGLWLGGASFLRRPRSYEQPVSHASDDSQSSFP